MWEASVAASNTLAVPMYVPGQGNDGGHEIMQSLAALRKESTGVIEVKEIGHQMKWKIRKQAWRSETSSWRSICVYVDPE
jgi:hypothetical protein